MIFLFREHTRKVILFAGICAAAFVGYLVYLRSPLLPPCLLRKWTGLYCPGCGVTRASHSLFHGDVTAAFGYNPLAMLMLPAVIYGMGHELAAWAWHRPEWRLRLGTRWTLLLAWLVIGYGVIRNLPGFDFLRP